MATKTTLTDEQQKLVDQMNDESDKVISGNASTPEVEQALAARFQKACEVATPEQRERMIAAVNEHWEEDQASVILGAFGDALGGDALGGEDDSDGYSD